MKYFRSVWAMLILAGVTGCGGGDTGIGPEGVTPEIERQDQEAMDRIGEQEARGMEGLVDVVEQNDPPACVD